MLLLDDFTVPLLFFYITLTKTSGLTTALVECLARRKSKKFTKSRLNHGPILLSMEPWNQAGKYHPFRFEAK